MVANVHGGSVIVAARLLNEMRHKEEVKAASDTQAAPDDGEIADTDTPAALQQKLADMADDMASVATQFRNRRELEKKEAGSAEGLERVLDEEAGPKAQKLVAVTAVQDLAIDTLLVRARSLFPDDSDLVVVLRELLRRRQLEAIQRRRIEKLLETVVDQADPKRLKAGVNCAIKARLFGAALGFEAQLLRQTYRRFLCSDGRAIDDYQEWISSYGYRVRHQVLAFVEESLGCDIRAEDPSCSHVEFGYLLEQVRKLRLLRSADREFVGGLMERRLVPPREEEEADWLLLLCALVERDIVPEEVVREALDACLLLTHAQRSTWLDGVRSACKRLPTEIFLHPGEAPDQAEIIRDDIQHAFARLLDHSYAAELAQQRRQAE